jgi:ribosomal-protein-alanine acetyltransferase
MSPEAQVRPATTADLPGLAALETALMDAEAWSPAALGAELESRDRTVLVADAGGGPVGYAVLVVVGEVADLLRIGVRRYHQRRGLASTLLAEALAAARARGARRCLLEVSAANEAALAFYQGRGFTEIDRRPRYYRDGTDAVVLERGLAP